MTLHHLKQVLRFAAVKHVKDKSIEHRHYAQSIKDDKIDQQLNFGQSIPLHLHESVQKIDFSLMPGLAPSLPWHGDEEIAIKMWT